MGPGKPEHIFAQTGRLPAFAGGNADVDIEMLSAAKFAVIVNHDDDGARVRLHQRRRGLLRQGKGTGLDR